MCGSKWDKLSYNRNAFFNRGDGIKKSTARHGCCPANKYMSSPEGTGTFVEANSCSTCPAGTHVSLATSVLNDEISCECDVGTFKAEGSTSCQRCAIGTCSDVGSVECSACAKMPDGCKGKTGTDRTCYPRKAVDELNADGSGTHSKYGPVAEWDMSLVTDLSYAFSTKGSFNGDISKWQTQNVKSMRGSK